MKQTPKTYVYLADLLRMETVYDTLAALKNANAECLLDLEAYIPTRRELARENSDYSLNGKLVVLYRQVVSLIHTKKTLADALHKS